MRDTDVQRVLEQIQLASWYRECEWEVQEVTAWIYPDGWSRADVNGPTARFRIVYNEPDVETGETKWQYARWWYVEPDFSEENLIKTAWLALTVSDEHRRREGFTVNGKRIFSPHTSIMKGK